MIAYAGRTLGRSYIPALTMKMNDTMWRPVCSGQDRNGLDRRARLARRIEKV